MFGRVELERKVILDVEIIARNGGKATFNVGCLLEYIPTMAHIVLGKGILLYCAIKVGREESRK